MGDGGGWQTDDKGQCYGEINNQKVIIFPNDYIRFRTLRVERGGGVWLEEEEEEKD